MISPTDVPVNAVLHIYVVTTNSLSLVKPPVTLSNAGNPVTIVACIVLPLLDLAYVLRGKNVLRSNSAL